MNFADQFSFPAWNISCWLIVIALFLAIEIYGAMSGHRDATLTYLILTTCNSFPLGHLCLFLAWLVLGWHFNILRIY